MPGELAASRFPMTLGAMAWWITALVAVPVSALMVALAFALPADGPPWARLLVGVLALTVPITLGATALLAPRAVSLDERGLAIERLAWPAFSVRWDEVTRVEHGPPIEMFGKVRRVAGNGGLMGFTGLYRVDGVGMVRLWATRLGRPTVVVHRASGLPLVLGVDAPDALLAAVQRRRGDTAVARG